MALLPDGKRCDRVIYGKRGEYFCNRRAKHEIKGHSGGELHYCNKHIKAARKEYA